MKLFFFVFSYVFFVYLLPQISQLSLNKAINGCEYPSPSLACNGGIRARFLADL